MPKGPNVNLIDEDIVPYLTSEGISGYDIEMVRIKSMK